MSPFTFLILFVPFISLTHSWGKIVIFKRVCVLLTALSSVSRIMRWCEPRLWVEREAAEEHWWLMDIEWIVATVKNSTVKVGQDGGQLLHISLIQYLKHIVQEVCEDGKLCGGLFCFYYMNVIFPEHSRADNHFCVYLLWRHLCYFCHNDFNTHRHSRGSPVSQDWNIFWWETCERQMKTKEWQN